MHVNILDLQEAIRRLPQPTFAGETRQMPVPEYRMLTCDFSKLGADAPSADETHPALPIVAVKKANSSTDFWYEWELVISC